METNKLVSLSLMWDEELYELKKECEEALHSSPQVAWILIDILEEIRLRAIEIY